MTGDDTIAELAGEPQRARTPREAAEERLHGWIERGWPEPPRFPKGREPWSGARNPVGSLPWPEIVCILAGLDPETSASADADGWALLPDALAFYGFDTFPRDRHGLHVLHTLAEEHIEPLRGLHLETMSAKDAIKAAVAANLPPPWLLAYLDSDHAMRWLPASLRADLRASIEAEPEELGKPKTIVDLASVGGRAKGGEQRAKFFPTVERLWKEGLTGAAIIKRLHEEHDPAPPSSTVYDWIKKLKCAKTA